MDPMHQTQPSKQQCWPEKTAVVVGDVVLFALPLLLQRCFNGVCTHHLEGSPSGVAFKFDTKIRVPQDKAEGVRGTPFVRHTRIRLHHFPEEMTAKFEDGIVSRLAC
jgi:hypothetical protein